MNLITCSTQHPQCGNVGCLTFRNWSGVPGHVEGSTHANHASNTLPNSIAIKAHNLCKVCEGSKCYVGYAPRRLGLDELEYDFDAWLLRELQLRVVRGCLIVDVQVWMTLGQTT